MKIGIVGHEAVKFTPETEAKAREIIRTLLILPDTTLVSGHCHLGGIDIYAEEEADKLGIPKLIFPPAELNWYKGYRPRNIQIAVASDEVRVLALTAYPPTFTGRRFETCYHCQSSEHLKSGGCWTARHAMKLGKPAFWHLI